MAAKDWADVEAENLVWANKKSLATTRRQVAAALRAAEARGYKRAQDERMVLPPADVARDRLEIWPWGSESLPAQSDGGAT